MVPVDAQTRGHVVLCNAQSVRTTLQLAAGVHALSSALSNLETDLLGLAVQIVGAVAVEMATVG